MPRCLQTLISETPLSLDPKHLTMPSLPLLLIFVATLLGSLITGYVVAAWRARNALHAADKKQTELSAELAAINQRMTERDERINTLSQEITAERGSLQESHKVLGDHREQTRAHQVHAERTEQQITEVKQTLVIKEQAYADLNKHHQQLIAEHTQLKTSLEEKQLHFDKQLQLLEDNKRQLKTEFENLANQIFENKGKAFTEANRQSLDGVLNPFKKQIDDFKKQAQDIHHKDTQQQAQLRSELGQLKELNKQITEEAHALATALKGQKKVQGNWAS